MSNEPRLPDRETIDRHTAKLRELVRRMDDHILDLDELNVQLEAELVEQQQRAIRLRRASRIAERKKETES